MHVSPPSSYPLQEAIPLGSSKGHFFSSNPLGPRPSDSCIYPQIPALIKYTAGIQQILVERSREGTGEKEKGKISDYSPMIDCK